MAATESTSTSKVINVAVLGNPNTGKSTLFNALTGATQRTGNYPGVTVERRVGRVKADGAELLLTDLPGTYSLCPRSPDEMVAVQFLLGSEIAESPPDVLLCVVDASNLKRNLFLVSQLLDLGLPTVIALNMTDVAQRRGLEINLDKLASELGADVVPVQAHRRVGLDSLKQAIQRAAQQRPTAPNPHNPFPAAIGKSLERLKAVCPDDCSLKQFVVTRMLFDGEGTVTDRLERFVNQPFLENLPKEKECILSSDQISIGEHESRARYDWISKLVEEAVHQRNPTRRAWSARFDDWLTHPVWGLAVAVVVLTAMFQLVFYLAEPASTAIDWFQSLSGAMVAAVIPEGMLQSLLTDGVVAGVGAVLVFLPQIMFLFLALALLEDSGYLARASYLLDKFLSRLGLSGSSTFPLLSSFACAIPGVMATRVIRDPRERLITILVAPLMSCSARLPVYVLMISAFVPNERLLGGWLGLQGLTMLAMYSIGVIAAIVVVWVIRRLILRESSTEFIMELPNYKMPQWGLVFRRVWEGAWAFVHGAGTLIVAVTILVWAAGYFPRELPGNPDAETLMAAIEQHETRLADLQAQFDATGDTPEREALAVSMVAIEEEIFQLQNEYGGLRFANSYLGRGGKWIEPVVEPLGWDWRIGSAVIAAFPAREVVVSTMGVIFGLGGDVDEENDSLRERLSGARRPDGSPLFTLPVALSVMVFFALCAQCASTLAVIKRETNSWRWPVVTFVYMTTLAYVAAWAVFQISSRWFG